MRIFQLSSSVNSGDAIGNSARLMKRTLQYAGYETELYARLVDQRKPGEVHDIVADIADMPKTRETDIIIYRMSNASPLNKWWVTIPGKKVLFYHNVTPPHFFEDYRPDIVPRLKEALTDTVDIRKYVDYCVTASQFSKNDLIGMGYYEEKIEVMPSYFFPSDIYEGTADMSTLLRYSDEWVNVLFVGRFVPNKKQEDIIRAFAFYHKHMNAKSRLILVGSAHFSPLYEQEITKYINSLGMNHVLVKGKVSFSELLAYYKCADAFLCMSEHEGFCVPLIEAMYFGVPIIAYDTAATPETLGGSGILIQDKDPVLVASLIDRLARDPVFKSKVIASQNTRLCDFNHVAYNEWLISFLQRVEAE